MQALQAQAVEGHLRDTLAQLEKNAAQSSLHERMAIVQAGVPLLAQLRALNRTANERARIGKRKVSEARSQIDAVSISLQNLKYQERHLQDEIRQCRDFQSVYQTIALVELDEFKEKATAEDTAEDVLNDHHALQLARLRFELSERKRLENEKRRVQTQKAALLKENRVKKRRLEGLESDLKDMLSGTARVRSRFEEADEEREIHEQEQSKDVEMHGTITPKDEATTPKEVHNERS